MSESLAQAQAHDAASAHPPGVARKMSLVLAVTSAAVLHLYALWPLKDLVRRWNDFAFVYAAGRAWLLRGSPYDVPLWRSQWAHIYPSFAGLTPPVLGAPSQPYLYPPHWAILAVPMGTLPWRVTCRLWDAVNVAAYAAIVYLLIQMLPRTKVRLTRDVALWFCVALVASNGAIRWTFWECQLSMVPTLGVVGAFYAWAHRRPTWLGLCVFVALLKPQIGVLPVAYLALIGGLGGVSGGALAAAAVGAVAMVYVDWHVLPTQIRECVQLHMSIDYNALDNFYSLSSLLAGFGKAAFVSQLFGFGVVAALAWKLRRTGGIRTARFEPLPELAMACATCAAFIPLHGYDLVILSPLVFWAHTLRQIWLKATMFILIAVASRAHTWGALHGMHPLGPWVTLTLFCLSLYAWLDTRVHSSSNRDSASRQPIELPRAAESR